MKIESNILLKNNDTVTVETKSLDKIRDLINEQIKDTERILNKYDKK